MSCHEKNINNHKAYQTTDRQGKKITTFNQIIRYAISDVVFKFSGKRERCILFQATMHFAALLHVL